MESGEGAKWALARLTNQRGRCAPRSPSCTQTSRCNKRRSPSSVIMTLPQQCDCGAVMRGAGRSPVGWLFPPQAPVHGCTRLESAAVVWRGAAPSMLRSAPALLKRKRWHRYHRLTLDYTSSITSRRAPCTNVCRDSSGAGSGSNACYPSSEHRTQCLLHLQPRRLQQHCHRPSPRP